MSALLLLHQDSRRVPVEIIETCVTADKPPTAGSLASKVWPPGRGWRVAAPLLGHKTQWKRRRRLEISVSPARAQLATKPAKEKLT